jgi:TolA-binding protein
MPHHPHARRRRGGFAAMTPAAAARPRPVRATPPLAALALLALVLWPVGPALAQMESREGIALQNQILQLRQELDQLRRAGGVAAAPAPARPPSGGGAPQGELVSRLLERVTTLEEEVRRLRGRVDEQEFRNQQQTQQIEKLQGDIDFRLQQLEGGGGRAPAAPRPAPAAAPPPIAAPPAAASAAAAPRPPERAIADGQAALGRRDYATAEAAAREALAARGGGTRATDAGLLLGDALAGKRDFAGAALAYDDAFRRNRTGPRAPDALIGLANSFNSLGNKREACDTLNDLRSNFPNLRAPQSERAAEARRRAGCR